MFDVKLASLVCLALAAVSSATNVHVNAGCILINGTPTCNPNSLSVDGGSATIYARFNGGDNASPQTIPGCRLDATWPADYGDIFFGDDNCLYDAGGQNIGGQCCDVGTGGSTLVTNPYA